MVGYMILIAVIIGLAITSIIILLDENSKEARRMGAGFGFFIVGIMVSFLSEIISPKPSAIDVYRGKTSLKITETVQDSIVIKRDSIVVWKEKIK